MLRVAALLRKARIHGRVWKTFDPKATVAVPLVKDFPGCLGTGPNPGIPAIFGAKLTTPSSHSITCAASIYAFAFIRNSQLRGRPRSYRLIDPCPAARQVVWLVRGPSGEDPR